MTNSSCQLCNSHNAVKNIMDLQFFWKNVNKQLKSADFLSEMSKFQKILLNKVFAFFIPMLDHTLVLAVQPPNSQKSHTSNHVLLLALYLSEKYHDGNFLIFCPPWPNFEIYEKKLTKNPMASRQSWKKLQNM